MVVSTCFGGSHRYLRFTHTLNLIQILLVLLHSVTGRTRIVMKMKKVVFQYEGTETPALKDVNVKLTLGSRVGIVGKNGAGKTTLLVCEGWVPCCTHILGGNGLE